MTSRADVEDKLALLKQSYLDRLPDQFSTIADAAVKLDNLDGGAAVSSVEILKSQAHKLAGSGATFGFPAISEAARKLESACSAIQQQQTQADDSDIQSLVDVLGEAMQAAISDVAAAPQKDFQGFTGGDLSKPDAEATRTVILIGYQPDQAKKVQEELVSFDFDVSSMDSEADLISLDRQHLPAGIVVDLDYHRRSASGDVSLLSKVRTALDEKKLKCPLIVISDVGDVPSRLQGLRANASSFLIKPVSTTDLVDTIDRAFGNEGGEDYRILVVDDDESTALYTKIILNNAGMIVETENDPMNILQRLEDFAPELILMDLYMPGCNGHELASVIRQQEVYSGIPIVFLSGEDNVDVQLGAMEYGGDDFLTKPIRPAHLISSVRVRSQRFRSLRSRMIRDSMTGLLNHTTTQEFLKNEIGRAQREKTTLAVAALDIDHFKAVNDTYGHAVGDNVIKSLSRLLKQRLRGVDIIGRMGGEEFAAILVGASIEKATEILNEIRQSFSDIVQFGDGQEFSVTLSCGISGYPAFSTQADLLEAADKALYEAKHGGRNKVVTA